MILVIIKKYFSYYYIMSLITQVKQSVINAGIKSAVNNTGVLRHGLNANYYFNHNRPIMGLREGFAAGYDAITGSRR
jgi:hypothetical protein